MFSNERCRKMNSKKKPTSAVEFLDRFLLDHGLDRTSAKRFRSDFRKVLAQFPGHDPNTISAADLPVSRESLASKCTGVSPAAPSASRYFQIVRWGIERGYIEAPEEAINDMGFPEFRRQAITAEWRQAEVVYATAKRVAATRNVRFAEADSDFWLEAFGCHMKSRRSGRSEVNTFRRVWEVEAAAGRVPRIAIPMLPSKRPVPYRLAEADWPAAYQTGLKTTRSWLEDSIVKGRGRKQKKRPISVEQQINNLLRFGGYFANIEHEDISILTWADLFSIDRVLRFLFFTDPKAKKKVNGHRYSSGITQESYLNTFIDFCRGPLVLPEKAFEIENLRKQFLFEKKRQPIRGDLTPNHIFAAANRLLERAAQRDQVGHHVMAAILRRDALLIVLTMLWPRRVDLWHRLELTRHIQIKEGSPIRICLWREESKPEKADQVLEIPPEVEGLFRHYLKVDRPIIIADQKDDGKLFVAEGGSGVKHDTPRVTFRIRMKEELGFEIGTHALRKIWTPRYLDYSDGDELTAMAILDTSMKNIVSAYRDGQDRCAAKDFVDTTDQLWREIP
jgi:hypothetical protein